MNIVSLIVGILFSAVLTGILIWIVAKLGLGLEVDGFVPAFVAGIIIAVLSGLITWLLNTLGITIGGGLLGAIVHLVIAAGVLMVSGNIVRGLRVKGFVGAIVAALAIGVVAWVIAALLGALGMA